VKHNKSCSNCIKGKILPINDDIFCPEKGIVSHDYVCSKHKLNLTHKTSRETGSKCIDCENFILDTQGSDDPSSIGLCRLFSVRKFDGTRKNACSKLVKKTQIKVS
jgi:hypothetical protein